MWVAPRDGFSIAEWADKEGKASRDLVLCGVRFVTQQVFNRLLHLDGVCAVIKLCHPCSVGIGLSWLQMNTHGEGNYFVFFVIGERFRLRILM